MRAIAFGGFIIGIGLFFFVKWWIALSILLVSLFFFPKVQQHAANGVLKVSLYNPTVYKEAINNNVFELKEIE